MNIVACNVPNKQSRIHRTYSLVVERGIADPKVRCSTHLESCFLSFFFFYQVFRLSIHSCILIQNTEAQTTFIDSILKTF